ncbi:MAG: tetratricopeptide repeat protein [Caldilineaceae bacterium]|nr:tetratricopeptide repeat protein [Caldilineaceae bacterium]
MDISSTPHNISLYRLNGFTGSRHHLLTLHEWLTGEDDLPAIAISGEQGNGKSTLATAAAWNHFYHFTDGIIQVSPAGANPFRLYDVVRVLDSVLGTALTRSSEDRWGISILEQLYKRRRLLLLDKLAGATPRELNTLVEIISHLHENEGQSRIVLIDRNFSASIAALVRHQHIHLEGLDLADVPLFISRRAPQSVRERAIRFAEEIHAVSGGSPMCMRLIMGLMQDFQWDELAAALHGLGDDLAASVSTSNVCALALETYALQNPAAGVFLSRLVRAVGGVSQRALRELFWDDLGNEDALQATVDSLAERGLLELDPFRQRVLIHPVVRRYLEENAVMLGEEWDRRHAAFYIRQARQYQQLPLKRWHEVDPDWGNVFVGADWCAQRISRIWQRDPLKMLEEAGTSTEAFALSPSAPLVYRDLRLARDYALALADYAFWRHPPGIVRWLAVGAVAALAIQDIRNYAWFAMNIGRQLFFMGRVQEAVEWLERARPIFDERDLLSELAYVHTDLGTSYRILDEPRRALEHFRAAFECVAQLGDQHGLATAYMNLGSAYFSLNQPERALADHRRALRVALRSHDSHLIASVYNNMGLALETLEQHVDAVKAYKFALEMFEQTNDLTGVSACYNNLGSVSYARGDYVQALMWYERDMKLLQQRGAWTDLAATMHNLGHVALEQEDLDQALDYFEQSRALYAAFDLNEYVEEEEEMIRFAREQLANKVLTKR